MSGSVLCYAVVTILEGPAGNEDAIDPSWLEIVKLYIGAPITNISVVRNSARTAWLKALTSWTTSNAGTIAESGSANDGAFSDVVYTGVHQIL
jgi:hypothetical protein